MQELPIKRDLDEAHRLIDIQVAGMLCSVYQTRTEVIVADAYDNTKIYQITSREFYHALDEKED